MIRVHAVQVLVPLADGSTHRATTLGIELSLSPERIDTVQAVDVNVRKRWSLPSKCRAIVRYQDLSTMAGYRLYVVADTRDSVERKRAGYFRSLNGGPGYDDWPDVPDNLPEEL